MVTEQRSATHFGKPSKMGRTNCTDTWGSSSSSYTTEARGYLNTPPPPSHLAMAVEVSLQRFFGRLGRPRPPQPPAPGLTDMPGMALEQGRPNLSRRCPVKIGLCSVDLLLLILNLFPVNVNVIVILLQASLRNLKGYKNEGMHRSSLRQRPLKGINGET